MPMRIPAALLAVSGLVLSMAACSRDDASAGFCRASANTQAEVADVSELLSSGGAKIKDVRAQVQAVIEAAEIQREEAQGLAPALRDDIEAADAAFAEAVGAVPDDARLRQVAAQYQAAVDGWQASMRSMRTTAGCS